jgi:hypothetical protein
MGVVATQNNVSVLKYFIFYLIFLFYSHENGNEGMTGPLLIGTTLGLIIETELASGNSSGSYSDCTH